MYYYDPINKEYIDNKGNKIETSKLEDELNEVNENCK